jgi:hypothetical protein
MDTVSAASVAEELGTSIPRVVRAVERLGMTDARAANGRLSLSGSQRQRLRRYLGVTPAISGLTRSEAIVLSALRLAPLGVVSARALARRASISPTTASRALRNLEAKGHVLRERQTIAAGRAQTVDVWKANVLSGEWGPLASALSGVELPERKPPQRSRRVPIQLRHLFWGSRPAALDLRRNGAFIALRLLRLQDPEGLAWGIENLRPSDWRRAARARGLAPPIRAMAKNFAAGERRSPR